MLTYFNHNSLVGLWKSVNFASWLGNKPSPYRQHVMNTTSVKQVTHTSEPATRKQTFALFTLAKKLGHGKTDYRSDNLTRQQASDLIADFSLQVKQLTIAAPTIGKPTIKRPAVATTLKDRFKTFMQGRATAIANSLKSAMKYESVVMNDTDFVKDDGKRYFVCGLGCAIVWLKYDGRSKKAKEINELVYEMKRAILPAVLNEFPLDVRQRYEMLGCPIEALYSQDLSAQLAFYYAVCDFAKQEGVKNISVQYRYD